MPKPANAHRAGNRRQASRSQVQCVVHAVAALTLIVTMRVASTAVLAISALAGCGRIGFDARGSGDVDPANSDGSPSTDGVIVDDAPGGGAVFRLTAIADTALNSAATALNYGGATSFNVRTSNVGTFVGLLRFDLTPLAGKSVTSAMLELRTSSVAFSGATNVRVYTVLETWTEGTMSGGTGVSNYTMRTGGQAWTSAGCGPGSRDSTELGMFAPTTTDTTYTTSIPVSQVASWIDVPSTNAGLTVVADQAGPSETAGFVSREGGAGAPVLVVIVP